LMVQVHALVAALVHGGELDEPDERPSGRRRAPRMLVATVATTAVLAAGGARLGSAVTLEESADGATLVLAHRGFTAGGVENTIEALDAASEAGADLVEMDVQQTSDGGWVLMHDTDLKRLAGLDTSVG